MADEAETILQNAVSRLGVEEMALTGCTHKFTVYVTDYTITTSGASDTVTWTLIATPTDFIVTRCFVNVTTAFAGNGSAAITGEVGTDGDPNNFITATELDLETAGPVISAVGADPVTLAGTYAAASDNLIFRGINATAGGPDEWTAGVIDIYIGLLDCNAI